MRSPAKYNIIVVVVVTSGDGMVMNVWWNEQSEGSRGEEVFRAGDGELLCRGCGCVALSLELLFLETA